MTSSLLSLLLIVRDPACEALHSITRTELCARRGQETNTSAVGPAPHDQPDTALLRSLTAIALASH